MYTEFKTVVAVVKIHTSFNNRGSCTNVNANEKSRLKSQKENSNDNGASENGMLICVINSYAPSVSNVY